MTNNLKILKSSDDIIDHLPKSLQLMLEIDKRAHAEVDALLAAVERGETTLEKILAERGIT